MKFSKLSELLALLGVSTLFLFEYFSLNLLNVIEPSIVKEFNCTNLQIGWLGAIYFYAMVALLIPAGFIIDKYNLNKIIIISAVVGTMGNFFFAISQNYFQLLLSRAIVGCCLGPFALISCIKFISKIIIQKNKIGAYISIILFIGIFGGALSQDLLGVLVAKNGWRVAMIIVGICGTIVSCILLLTINIFKTEFIEKANNAVSFIDMIKSFVKSHNIRDNIRLGIMASSLNLPLFVLGSLFGVAYLEQCHGILPADASSITAYLFWGMLLGCVLFGMFSFNAYNQRMLLTIGAFASLISLMYLIFQPSIGNIFLKIIFFAIGVSAGSHVLSFAFVEKITSYKYLGLAEGFHSTMIFLGGALIQPLFGKILDLSHKYIITNNYWSLSLKSSYRAGFLLLLIFIILGIYSINRTDNNSTGPTANR